MSKSNGSNGKKKVGRPKKEIDLGIVAQLAEIQCTDGEIAAAVGVDPSTITYRRQTDEAFSKAINHGRENGKRSLRRKLYQIAMDDTHKSQLGACIWLSKQYLGMSDRAESHQTVRHEGQVTVNLDEYRKLDRSEQTRVFLERLSAGGN